MQIRNLPLLDGLALLERFIAGTEVSLFSLLIRIGADSARLLLSKGTRAKIAGAKSLLAMEVEAILGRITWLKLFHYLSASLSTIPIVVKALRT